MRSFHEHYPELLRGRVGFKCDQINKSSRLRKKHCAFISAPCCNVLGWFQCPSAAFKNKSDDLLTFYSVLLLSGPALFSLELLVDFVMNKRLLQGSVAEQ